MANETQERVDEAERVVYTGAAVPPFAVYEDYDGNLHIIDGTTRIMLSDVYAYDGKTEGDAAEERMEQVAAALNAGWAAALASART